MLKHEHDYYKQRNLKRLGNLFEEVYSIENLQIAYDKATKGKTKRKEIIKMEEITNLKVSDVINFSENDYRETKNLLKTMNGMVRQYVENIDNPDALELLKREFNGQLMYLATFYAKILCFRENFQYLETQRKELKAKAMQLMMGEDPTLKTTNVEKVVYAYPYYSERVKLIEKLKSFFYLVDLQYKNYENTQRSIYQSISILSKEKQAIQS